MSAASTAEILGWVGNIGFVIGCVLMAKKRPVQSLVWYVFGNLNYLAVGFLLGVWSLFCISLLMAVINSVSFFRWRK